MPRTTTYYTATLPARTHYLQRVPPRTLPAFSSTVPLPHLTTAAFRHHRLHTCWLTGFPTVPVTHTDYRYRSGSFTPTTVAVTFHVLLRSWVGCFGFTDSTVCGFPTALPVWRWLPAVCGWTVTARGCPHRLLPTCHTYYYRTTTTVALHTCTGSFWLFVTPAAAIPAGSTFTILRTYHTLCYTHTTPLNIFHLTACILVLYHRHVHTTTYTCIPHYSPPLPFGIVLFRLRLPVLFRLLYFVTFPTAPVPSILYGSHPFKAAISHRAPPVPFTCLPAYFLYHSPFILYVCISVHRLILF